MADERRNQSGGVGVTMSSGWRAGAASTTFDVPLGTPMAGYSARDGGAERTLDPLTVSCFALVAGSERFTLVALDLIGVDEAMVEAVAVRVGLPAQAIALCASHTHSGPAGVLQRLHPAERAVIDPALRETVIDAVSGVITQAFDGLTDAELTFARATADGVSANRNAPDGPFDPTVSVISARGGRGEPIATVVHFACHPTILPATSRAISADFPGAVRRHLPHSEFGIVLFANGAAGDVSTRYTRQSQDLAEVERVGIAIAETVKSAGGVVALSPRIHAVCQPVPVRLRSREEITETLERAALATARTEAGKRSAAERRIEETRAQGVAILSEIAERIETIPDRVNVCSWRLGELTLRGFPGELFASLGTELTQSDEPALVLGYTNGYRGYFPDRAAFEAGTYEALSSPYAPGASEELIAWLRGKA